MYGQKRIKKGHGHPTMNGIPSTGYRFLYTEGIAPISIGGWSSSFGMRMANPCWKNHGTEGWPWDDHVPMVFWISPRPCCNKHGLLMNLDEFKVILYILLHWKTTRQCGTVMSALQYNSINNHQYVHDLYYPFMVSCWGWFTIAVLVLYNVLNYQPPYFTRNAWWIVYPTLEADAIGITTLTLIQFGHFSVFIYIYNLPYSNTIADVDLVRGCQNPRKIILKNHHPPIFDGSPVLCSNMTFTARVRRVLSWGQTALEIGPGVWLFECRLNPLGVDMGWYRI